MNIFDYIDFKKFNRICSLNITNSRRLIEIFKRAGINIESDESMINNLINIEDFIFLLNEEIISFNKFLNINELTPDFNNIISEIINNVYHTKRKSIYDFIFTVYSNTDKNNIISYKDNDNITEEIKRILISVDDNNILKNFLDSFLLEVGYAREFLKINNTLPAMITSNRIIIYSALLNYSYSEIYNMPNYKEYLNKITRIKKFPENWDEISRIFKKFLKELSKRTINY